MPTSRPHQSFSEAQVAARDGKLCSRCTATNDRSAGYCRRCGRPFLGSEGGQARRRAALAAALIMLLITSIALMRLEGREGVAGRDGHQTRPVSERMAQVIQSAQRLKQRTTMARDEEAPAARWAALGAEWDDLHRTFEALGVGGRDDAYFWAGDCAYGAAQCFALAGDDERMQKCLRAQVRMHTIAADKDPVARDRRSAGQLATAGELELGGLSDLLLSSPTPGAAAPAH